MLEARSFLASSIVLSFVPKSHIAHFTNTINYYHLLLENVPQLHSSMCHAWGTCSLGSNVVPSSLGGHVSATLTSTLSPEGQPLPPPSSRFNPTQVGLPPDVILLARRVQYTNAQELLPVGAELTKCFTREGTMWTVPYSSQRWWVSEDNDVAGGKGGSVQGRWQDLTEVGAREVVRFGVVAAGIGRWRREYNP